ncbi:MAG: GNAT family N-acetyltransferase [Chloroflexi bacterium]|nr:GNAT family N-acetyltransferase [Chloroflexota bacterium]
MSGSGAGEVRPLARPELSLVEAHINLDWAESGKHRARLDRQDQGEVLYFIAWRGATPSGHLLLEWGGADDEPISSRLLDCPNLEDLFVMPEFRSRGIGSMLLGAAITAAREAGYTQLGLGVAVDNPGAMRLYERKGFQDSGIGEYTTGGSYLDREGTVQTWQEICTYRIRLLSCAQPA